eukprot:TRINITY_DN10221_c0_g1_i3.p1 TRINITY_DN10221_c0_g1~~TRINITY_DN10221_c0_g1_i3.p1  ORF type:complete len:118 (-),score=22.60 TRINITY_DN10221_c0_g1_i3:554-907(-)
MCIRDSPIFASKRAYGRTQTFLNRHGFDYSSGISLYLEPTPILLHQQHEKTIDTTRPNDASRMPFTTDKEHDATTLNQQQQEPSTDTHTHPPTHTPTTPTTPTQTHPLTTTPHQQKE